MVVPTARDGSRSNDSLAHKMRKLAAKLPEEIRAELKQAAKAASWRIDSVAWLEVTRAFGRRRHHNTEIWRGFLGGNA